MSGRRISSAVLAALAMASAPFAANFNLSGLTPAPAPPFSYNADNKTLVISMGAGSHTVTGTLPAGVPVDSVYMDIEADAAVNVVWSASLSGASLNGADRVKGALIASGDLVGGRFTVSGGAAITSGAGAALNINGQVAILNASISGNSSLGPLVRSAGNVYIGQNSSVTVTGTGERGAAVSAADTVFIISGAVSGRGGGIAAGSEVFIDDGSRGSAQSVFFGAAGIRSAVRIEADSAAVSAGGHVLVNNPAAKIINRPTGIAPAIAERGAGIRAGSVRVVSADSIAAMGIGTAIRVSGNPNEPVSAISAGTVFSASGTAVRADGANVVIDGSTKVISNAAGSGSAVPDFSAVRIEGAASDITLGILGGVAVSATGINASAVRANRGGAGSLTVTVSGDPPLAAVPVISSADGSAVSLGNGAALVMKNGKLSNSSTNGIAVISASGAAAADIVTVNGGSIAAIGTSGQGAAIRVSGGGGVTVDGEVQITANGTNGRAIQTESGRVYVSGAGVKMAVHEGALSVGIQTAGGEVTVRNAEIEVTNGTGILTSGGAVTVNASLGMTASVKATVGGTAIRAARPASGGAGTVRIGGSAGDKTVTVSSAAGRAIHADDSVRVLDYANVSTVSGKAVMGGHVIIGTVSDGEEPIVTATGAAGVDTAAAVTAPAVAGSAASVTMDGGKIVAGTPHPSQSGEAQFSAAAVTVTGSAAGTVRIINGSIETRGSIPAVRSASANADVFIGSIYGGAPVIKVGRNGTAVSAAGRVQIDGGEITAGSGALSRGISISGGKTLLITKGSVTVGDSGTAVASAAAVTDSIVGSGAVTVLGRGRAVDALGRVVISDNAAVSASSGAALSSPGDITLAGGAVYSADTCIASAKEVRITGNNVRLSGNVFANVSATGAAAVVSPGGTPALGRRLTIPAGRTFNVSGRATLATGPHDTLVIHGSVSTAGATADATGYFENSGKTVIADGGNVSFGAQTKATFENKTGGKIVLSVGAKLNGGAIDYFAWADTLSDFDLRGPGSVVIPPFFASASEVWGDGASATVAAYTPVNWQLPLISGRYAGFMGTPINFTLASGSFPEGASAGGSPLAISGTGWITGLITAAGTYSFKARAANEAGAAEKDFAVTVTRAGTPTLGEHFAALITSGSDKKTLGAGASSVDLKYSGAPIVAEVAGTGIAGYNTTYGGFGEAEFLWREESAEEDGEGEERPLTAAAPENPGAYFVYVSLAQGRDFEDDGEDGPILIGKVTISPNTLSGILNVPEVVYTVDILAGRAVTDTTITIPDVRRYGAVYDVGASGIPAVTAPASIPPEDLVTGGAARINGAGTAITFSVTDQSAAGNAVTFKLPVKQNGAENIIEGPASDVTVRVLFKSEEEMISVAEYERAVPVRPNDELAVVIGLPSAPPLFAAGPNPASRSSGAVNFYIGTPARGNDRLSGALTVYSASGNAVRKIPVSASVTAWDLKDAKGRLVPPGTYLVRGAVTVNGKRERVSVMIGVR